MYTVYRLSKRDGAKFRELSSNFLKLADVIVCAWAGQCKKRRRLGWVNPTSCSPLAAGSELTQPTLHLFLQISMSDIHLARHCYRLIAVSHYLIVTARLLHLLGRDVPLSDPLWTFRIIALFVMSIVASTFTLPMLAVSWSGIVQATANAESTERVMHIHTVHIGFRVAWYSWGMAKLSSNLIITLHGVSVNMTPLGSGKSVVQTKSNINRVFNIIIPFLVNRKLSNIASVVLPAWEALNISLVSLHCQIA